MLAELISAPLTFPTFEMICSYRRNLGCMLHPLQLCLIQLRNHVRCSDSRSAQTKPLSSPKPYEVSHVLIIPTLATSPAAASDFHNSTSSGMPYLVLAMTTLDLIHARTHAKKHRQKVYSCDQCTKWYYHSKNLRDHKQTKHLGTRYMCGFEGCTVSVAQKKNLKRHREKHHKEVQDPRKRPFPSSI